MKRLKPTTILEYVLLILLAGLFLFPMIWMVVSAMKPEADVYKNLTMPIKSQTEFFYL